MIGEPEQALLSQELSWMWARVMADERAE